MSLESYLILESEVESQSRPSYKPSPVVAHVDWMYLPYMVSAGLEWVYAVRL